MTKQEFEEEISQHLNDTSQANRKAVLNDIEYNLALKDGALEAALQRAYGIIHGTADNRTQARRMRKKKQKREASLKSIGDYIKAN